MDIIVGMLLFIMYLCYRKQGERRLVVRPVHLNFNYWKRTEEAGCATGLLAFFMQSICVIPEGTVRV